MYDALYTRRFIIFFVLQLALLFGALFFQVDQYETMILPSLIKLNIAAGILLISRKKKLMWIAVALLVLAVSIFGASFFQRNPDENLSLRLLIYFIFYAMITYEIINQVWQADHVDNTVIIGVMSGYISLGLISFFLFMAVEIHHPGSFRGALLDNSDFQMRADGIMYYAYITLMTIGYGEIIPASTIAQKAAVLTGLIGQFYLVIITAIVVGKYLKHSDN